MPSIQLELPHDLAEALSCLKEVTSTSDEQVVTLALARYVADQRQRDTIERFFRE